MKRIYKVLMPGLMLLLAFCNENISYASSVVKPLADTANDSGNYSANYLKAREFIKLSAHDFSILTGKKLNAFQRLSFKITKLRIKHDLKKNPDLKVTDYLNKEDKGESFNILWYLFGLAGPIVGIFLSSIAVFVVVAIAPVIIAYVTKQDRVKIRSVWLGFGSGILIVLILALIIASALRGFG